MFKLGARMSTSARLRQQTKFVGKVSPLARERGCPHPRPRLLNNFVRLLMINYFRFCENRLYLSVFARFLGANDLRCEQRNHNFVMSGNGKSAPRAVLNRTTDDVCRR